MLPHQPSTHQQEEPPLRVEGKGTTMSLRLGMYERTHPLIEDAGIAALRSTHVLVCGVGGVGGFAVEALARGGVGRLTLVDFDVVTVSNKNRQLIALDSTVGKSKVQLLRDRVTEINDQCEVVVIDAFLLESDVDHLLDEGPYTYVLDAIDTVTTKITLIEQCVKRKIPVLSSMGAGGKMDPTKLHIADLFSTENCGLAAKCRSDLKKRGLKPGDVVTCFSSETSKKPLAPWPSLTGGRPRAVNGTISYIPSAFGLMLAGTLLSHAVTGKYPMSPPTASALAIKEKAKKAEMKKKAKKKADGLKPPPPADDSQPSSKKARVGQ